MAPQDMTDITDYWETNGIEKPTPVVVCAAIRFGGTILAGARHWDSVMRTQSDLIGIAELRKKGKEEQGFINQFGEFLTREDAIKVAKESGQRLRSADIGGALFSEDLY